jgi:hypothetical protein
VNSSKGIFVLSPELHSAGKVLADGGNTSRSIEATNGHLTSAGERGEHLAIIVRALQASAAAKRDFPSSRLTKLVASRLDMDDTDIADLKVPKVSLNNRL